jgi:RNA-binding protein
MAKLTARQRAHLKSIAHSLKPLFQIGREGVTDALIRTLEAAFQTRELFKVKVLDTAPLAARDAAAALDGRIDGMEVVQVIGRTLVLYRPDPDQPVIRLPR